MVTTGNLNLSPEALAALAQKANRSDNELARSLGISMDEIVDAQLPDTDANNKQIFESNPFFDPTKFGQALAANARVDAGGYITAEEINKSENGNDEENDLLEIIQNNLAREEAERARLQAEWDASEHDICGVSMSGENWRNLSNSLRDNEKSRNWLLNRFMQQGMTPQEAEAEAKLYELVYSGMSKPEQYRTDEENAAIREIPNHPNFRDNTKDFLDRTVANSNELSNQQTASASLHAGKESIKSGDDLISSISGNSASGNSTASNVQMVSDSASQISVSDHHITTNVNPRSDFNRVAPPESNIISPANQAAPVIQQPNQVASVQSYEMSVGI